MFCIFLIWILHLLVKSYSMQHLRCQDGGKGRQTAASLTLLPRLLWAQRFTHTLGGCRLWRGDMGDNICNLCNVCNIPYMLYLPCVRLFKRRLSRSHSIYFIAKTNNSSIPIFHCHLNDVESSPSTYSNVFIIKTSLFETTPSQKEKVW